MMKMSSREGKTHARERRKLRMRGGRTSSPSVKVGLSFLEAEGRKSTDKNGGG